MKSLYSYQRWYWWGDSDRLGAGQPDQHSLCPAASSNSVNTIVIITAIPIEGLY